jgi:hypothetical protein
VRDDYDGDLRGLATRAGHDVTDATRLLQQFTGIGATGADILLREVQDAWTWVRPHFDARATGGGAGAGFARRRATEAGGAVAGWSNGFMRLLTNVGALAVVFTAGCAGPTVINSDETTAAQTSVVTAAPTTTRPSNAHLANAFDFAADVDGQTGYYFTSPSGRWECAIVPRVSAGCQNAQSTSSIGVAGAPDEVPGPDGEPTAPNAVLVDRTAEPRFAALAPPGYALEPGPATVLPFNRVLAVAGFRCNIQEATGISCRSEAGGKGFTFSTDGFTATYTDVPADAP